MDWKTLGLVTAFFVAWIALNRWILPACGVNTCMSGCCCPDVSQQQPKPLADEPSAEQPQTVEHTTAESK